MQEIKCKNCSSASMEQYNDVYICKSCGVRYNTISNSNNPTNVQINQFYQQPILQPQQPYFVPQEKPKANQKKIISVIVAILLGLAIGFPLTFLVIIPAIDRAEQPQYNIGDFALNPHAPADRQIVELIVLSTNLEWQFVRDENGGIVYINRDTYTIGNSTYILSCRETAWLIHFNPETRQLRTTTGVRVVLMNASNRLMNNNGAEPFSPLNFEDMQEKLQANPHISFRDPNLYLTRTNDTEEIRRILNFN